MKGYRLKYVLKAIIQQKEKVLVNIFLLLLVKGGFLKSESCVYLNSDHMLNLLFHKDLKNMVQKKQQCFKCVIVFYT